MYCHLADGRRLHLDPELLGAAAHRWHRMQVKLGSIKRNAQVFNPTEPFCDCLICAETLRKSLSNGEGGEGS